MERSQDQLQGLSRQVLYDFEMVEALSKRLVDIQTGAPQPGWQQRFDTTEADLQRSWFEVNAMLESLLVRARSVTAFIYDSPPSRERVGAARKRGKAARSEDGFAEQYFDDPATWRSQDGRGKRPEILTDDELTNRVSREIAHPTYHRADFRHGGPPWNSYAIYTALADVMERFSSLVPSELVCEGFCERVEAALPAKQPKPKPPHSPGGYSVGPVATQGMPGK